MDIIKISVLGIVAIVVGMILKEVKPEYSFYVSFAAGVCILLLAAGKVTYLIDSIKKIQSSIPVDSAHIGILIKMIGITYIGQFSANMCKDAGYSAMAVQIEMFSKLSIMVISMPVLLGLLGTIQEFLG